MNATISRYEHDVMEAASMKGPMITSTVLHLLVFIIAAVGMPFMAKPLEDFTQVNVEIVNISDVTQTNQLAAPQKKQEETEKPEPPKPQPVKNEPAPAPELAEPAPPKIEEKKAEPEKPKEKPKPKPKPPEPEKPKEDTKSAFDSLLNNIAPDTEKPVEANDNPLQDTPDQGTPLSQIAELGKTLSLSEQDAIGQQLYPCWNVPAGAKYAEDLVVEIRVFMNRDGTIGNTQILDTGRYNRDTHFRAAADSANRALRNPSCVPLKFPPEKYNQLKVFVFRFDPRDML